MTLFWTGLLVLFCDIAEFSFSTKMAMAKMAMAKMGKANTPRHHAPATVKYTACAHATKQKHKPKLPVEPASPLQAKEVK